MYPHLQFWSLVTFITGYICLLCSAHSTSYSHIDRSCAWWIRCLFSLHGSCCSSSRWSSHREVRWSLSSVRKRSTLNGTSSSLYARLTHLQCYAVSVRRLSMRCWWRPVFILNMSLPFPPQLMFWLYCCQMKTGGYLTKCIFYGWNASAHQISISETSCSDTAFLKRIFAWKMLPVSAAKLRYFCSPLSCVCSFCRCISVISAIIVTAEHTSFRLRIIFFINWRNICTSTNITADSSPFLWDFPYHLSYEKARLCRTSTRTVLSVSDLYHIVCGMFPHT